MARRVILAKGAGVADLLRAYIADAPRGTCIWIPDQPSPHGGAQAALFDGVLALPDGAGAPSGLGSAFSYEASEVIAKPGPQTGIGLLALLRPRSDLPRSEVHRHWHEHIALANVIHHKATSYRQFRFNRAISTDAPNYAGFAILHFPDAEALRTGLYRDERDMETIRADVAEFAIGADTLFVTESQGTRT